MVQYLQFRILKFPLIIIPINYSYIYHKPVLSHEKPLYLPATIPRFAKHGAGIWIPTFALVQSHPVL